MSTTKRAAEQLAAHIEPQEREWRGSVTARPIMDAAERLLASRLDNPLHLIGEALADCGSPIEEAFVAGVLAATLDEGLGFEVGEEAVMRCRDMHGHVRLYQQVEYGRFRVDFVVEYWEIWDKRHSASCIVECDGFDFHDRTKELAARDKARTREIVLAGGPPVLRFAGTELYQDAKACAAQVLELLDKQVREQVRTYFEGPKQ